MTVLSDKSITSLCDPDQTDRPMIQPFYNKSIKVDKDGVKIASYGVSSGGYDIRAACEFKVFKPLKRPWWRRLFNQFILGEETLDYKDIREDQFTTVYGDKVLVEPGGFLLARSIERVAMPRDVIAMCIGKSTIARAGWNCLCTPIEPGWEGYITLEFQNTTNRPNMFYANEGVLQLVFHQLDQECETSYADRGGKYQSQEPSIILPKV